jgi:hypothetical protein
MPGALLDGFDLVEIFGGDHGRKVEENDGGGGRLDHETPPTTRHGRKVRRGAQA